MIWVHWDGKEWESRYLLNRHWRTWINAGLELRNTAGRTRFSHGYLFFRALAMTSKISCHEIVEVSSGVAGSLHNIERR